MDPRERQQKDKALKQGEAFQRLTLHPDWAYFRGFLEAAQSAYERKVHQEANRADHIALARALEGYDAIANALTGFDRAIEQIPKLRDQLEPHGTDTD